jgi:hypothetical protein
VTYNHSLNWNGLKNTFLCGAVVERPDNKKPEFPLVFYKCAEQVRIGDSETTFQGIPLGADRTPANGVCEV